MKEKGYIFLFVLLWMGFMSLILSDLIGSHFELYKLAELDAKIVENSK